MAGPGGGPLPASKGAWWWVVQGENIPFLIVRQGLNFDKDLQYFTPLTPPPPKKKKLYLSGD